MNSCILFIWYYCRNKIRNVGMYLTVGLPEIWNILEIQKMKICSEVRNFMGKMNFQSKCAEVSWLLRYSVFSVFTKISWPICLSKLWKNRAGYNFFEDIPGFGLLHRFQKGSNFWKLLIQQLTYKQNSVWLVFELYNFPRNFFNFRLVF